MGLIGNILGAFLGNKMPLSTAEKQHNAFNAQEAEKSRQFTADMSNTSYQRQVKDMEAAGLNPQMMYGNISSGASTPSGAMASSSGHSPRGILALQASAQLQKSLADVKLAQAEARLKQIEADYAPSKILAEIDGLKATAKSNDAKAALTLSEKVYQDTTNEYARDIIGANLQLTRNQSRVSEEQAKQIHVAAGLIALQQTTEEKKWANLDAQTRELLTRAGLNEKNYDVAAAQAQEIWSKVDLNIAQEKQSREQSALIAANKVAMEIQNSRAFKPGDGSNFSYNAYRGIYNVCEALGKLMGGSFVMSSKF